MNIDKILEKATSIELKAGHKYLIFIDKHCVSRADAVLLLAALKKIDVNHAVLLTTDGDPKTGVMVVEQEPEWYT